MSGHSKWATTKHKKAAIDSKRAKVFTRLGSLITIAARDGKSGDPNFNPSLRMAIDNAKAASMPRENIDRAIKRGTGQGPDGALIEDITYEAYGSHGVALLIHCLTDNRNRSVGDIKALLNKYGGSLASVGSVSYQFKKIGEISFDSSKSSVKGDDLELVLMESGADDYDSDDNFFVVRTDYAKVQSVKLALEAAGIMIDSSEITEIATTPIELDQTDTERINKLVDLIEDLDDVVGVYTNVA